MRFQNSIIINSSGQTGVDRAALDFALSNGLNCQGWCPAGRLAEDGLINARYPLNETNTSDSLVRTELNVANCDATLILYIEDLDKGTQATKDYTFEYRKPLFMWRVGHNSNVLQFKKWMSVNEVKILNIAGPKASNCPDIYGETLDALDRILADYVRLTDKRMY